MVHFSQLSLQRKIRVAVPLGDAKRGNGLRGPPCRAGLQVPQDLGHLVQGLAGLFF